MEYDSNPIMAPGYHEGVWRSIIVPNYQLKRTGDSSEVNGGAVLQIERSSNQALSQNRNDPSVFLDGRQESEAGEFGLSARYDVVSTRIADIDNAGPLVADSTRSSKTISGSWSKALSEHSTLSVDGSYEGVYYSGGPYLNYVDQTVGFRYSYSWSGRIATFLSLSNDKYVQAGGGPSSRLTTTTLGLDWKIADNLEGTFQAGRNTIDNGQASKQGSVEVNYTGERAGLIVNASRQITPSGQGGFVATDQANGRWSYAVSELNNAGIDMSWRKTFFIPNIVTDSSMGAWLQHEINSFWLVRTNYLYRKREQIEFGNANSNYLGMAFIFSHSEL